MRWEAAKAAAHAHQDVFQQLGGQVNIHSGGGGQRSSKGLIGWGKQGAGKVRAKQAGQAGGLQRRRWLDGRAGRGQVGSRTNLLRSARHSRRH